MCSSKATNDLDGLMRQLDLTEARLNYLACLVHGYTALDREGLDGKRASVVAQCDAVCGDLAKAIFAAACYRDLSRDTEEIELRGDLDAEIEALERVGAAVLEVHRGVESAQTSPAAVLWHFLDASIIFRGVCDGLASSIAAYYEQGHVTPVGAYYGWTELRKAAAELAPEVPAPMLDAARLVAIPCVEMTAPMVASAARAIYAASKIPVAAEVAERPLKRRAASAHKVAA